MSDLFRLFEQADSRPGPWVLVSLVHTEGSTYRKVGAHLLVSPSQHFGMLSGGCLEADVAQRSRAFLESGEASAQWVIDTRPLLGCQGLLTLVAERLPARLLEEVIGLRQARRSAVLNIFGPGPDWRPACLGEAPLEGAYSQTVLPPLRLLVFGSSPGSLPLLDMARLLGWEAERMVLPGDPNVRHLQGEANLVDLRALAGRVDRWTACVVMNHHVGRDAEVLASLWDTPTPFLGLLGSRRRRDQILERLAFPPAGVGIDPESRILYAPVGVKLGAEGAPQIALEICAQVQCVFAEVDSRQARLHPAPARQAIAQAS